MKTRIMIKNLGLGIVTVFLMMLSVGGYAQACPTNEITVSIRNMVSTSTTLEYDIYITNTGPTTMKLAAFTNGCVRYPAGMFTSGTLSVVTQPGETGDFPNMAPITANSAPASFNTQQLRWTHTPLAGESTSINLPNGVDLKFARFRLTNSGTPWVNQEAQLTLSTGGPPAGITVNTLNVYCEGGFSSTPVTLQNFSLVQQNPSVILLGPVAVDCFDAGTYTQTAPTCFGRTDGTATITMSPAPSSTTASYVLDGGSSIPVVLDSSNSFTITDLAAGPHTLSVTGDTGCAAAVSVPFTVDAGIQPPQPPLACYETATFNDATCSWDVTGTQPAPPTLACYETLGAFNDATCSWDVTGTQPAPPTLACYETLGAFNDATCSWDVTGTQPVPPTLACYETLGAFNDTTCSWDVTGTQPAPPTLACYETLGAFNDATCSWDVTGTQPAPPTLACYETLGAFNDTTCSWDVTGTQPIEPVTACYETATFNDATCSWDVTGTQPAPPTLACYETLGAFNDATCSWNVTGTQPAPPTLACYETLGAFNDATCSWDVTGTQPAPPTLACYETLGAFNDATCSWDVTGTQPVEPVTACYETATFNDATCSWDVTGTQPAPPTLACYETLGAFNDTTCSWDVTGTQPAPPTLACYETLGAFNDAICSWDVTGTQPAPPTLACYETLGAFNDATCSWDVTGTQPAPPTLACYETLGAFNDATCSWDVTGTQPAPPTLACYETLGAFNDATCSWDVTGTQPAPPTLACYETLGAFNDATCSWDVTGTQPPMPTLACYETATFNTTTCVWDVTGTQPTLGSVTTTAVGSYVWPLPYGTGLTYTASGVYTNTVGCNLATLNLTIIPAATTVNTFNIGTSCGATISSLSVTIIAAPVSGAPAYTFRITNMNTSAVFVVSRPVNSFALSSYAGITLGTPYQIEVSVNGGANYGTPCIVNTPAPVSTIGAQCGTVLTSMTQFVYATYVASVTGYKFRVTNTSSSASVEYIALSAQNRFSFSQLPPAFVSFGTTYSVEVSLRNTDGSYLPYNPGCDITTPAFPTSEVILSQCDMVATSNTQMINAVIVSGATDYRFELSNSSLSYNFSIDRALNTFNLNMFPGLTPGTTYTVHVAVRIGGVWGPLTGKACNLTTPGIAPSTIRTIAENDKFTAIAYPNPFAENFMFDVQTTAENTIQVRVYDMLGKQVENRNVEASDINALQFGDAYPSGVYNVIVSQGENTQTLRVIKR